MSTLERVSHISLILVSVAALGLIVEQRLRPATGPGRPSDITGTKPTIPGVEWQSRSGLSLVISVSSSCRFCGESLDFYKHLSLQRRVADLSVPVFFVSNEPEDRLREFLVAGGVVEPKVIRLAPVTLGMPATPTLLLIGPDGVVQATYIGKLSQADENRVLGTIDSAL